MLVEFIVFVASAVAFASALYFYLLYSRRPGNGSEVSKHFLETTPARQLVPRLNPLISVGDHLVVTSASGSYFEYDPGGSYWTAALEQWLLSGLKLTYLVVGGRGDTCNRLATFALEHPDEVEIRFYDGFSDNDEIARETAKQFFITHPVALFDSTGATKAFWLERFHFPESSMAMDVSYVSPRDIEGSALANKYIEKLIYMLDHTDVATEGQLESLVTKNGLAA